MIKAVFFDIDGTLFSHKSHHIPSSVIPALRELQEQGILIMTATGRHMIMIDHLLEDQISFDGYVTMTGQMCLDKEKRIFYKNPLSAKDTRILAELFQSHRLPLTFIEENRRYINYIDERVRTCMGNTSSLFPPVEAYAGAPLYQVAGFFSEEDALLIPPMLTESQLSIWSPGAGAVDIIPANGGKVVGIQKLLDHYGIGRTEIMAFGDGDNDSDMLAFAEIGVAMGNGSEAAKNAADYVTSDIDDDGVYRALGYYGLV